MNIPIITPQNESNNSNSEDDFIYGQKNKEKEIEDKWLLYKKTEIIDKDVSFLIFFKKIYNKNLQYTNIQLIEGSSKFLEKSGR